MNCEKIHMYLLNEENQALCPFCDEQLVEVESIEIRCCDHPNIIIDGFKIVCPNCGMGINQQVSLWISMIICIG